MAFPHSIQPQIPVPSWVHTWLEGPPLSSLCIQTLPILQSPSHTPSPPLIKSPWPFYLPNVCFIYFDNPSVFYSINVTPAYASLYQACFTLWDRSPYHSTCYARIMRNTKLSLLLNSIKSGKMNDNLVIRRGMVKLRATETHPELCSPGSACHIGGPWARPAGQLLRF